MRNYSNAVCFSTYGITNVSVGIPKYRKITPQEILIGVLLAGSVDLAELSMHL